MPFQVVVPLPPPSQRFPPAVVIAAPSNRAIYPPVPDELAHKVTLPPFVCKLEVVAVIMLPLPFARIAAPDNVEVNPALIAILPPKILIGPAMLIALPMVMLAVLLVLPKVKPVSEDA